MRYPALENNPELYSREILGVVLNSAQLRICEAITNHHRVLVKSGNGIGKSFMCAILAHWWYVTREKSICIISAPTYQQLRDVIWRYVRGFPALPGSSPKAPMVSDNPEHLMAGYTAGSTEAYQGRHSDNLLIIFDEATDIDPEFWTAAEGMMSGTDSRMIAICNPLNSDSQFAREENVIIDGKPKWFILDINTLNHSDLPISEEWISQRVDEWCEPDPTGEVEWKGSRYKPGPLFESRVMGRWPSVASSRLWSNEDIANISRDGSINNGSIVGVDVARYGSDYSVVMIAENGCITACEKYNGLSITDLSRRIEKCMLRYKNPLKVPILVDEAGVGGGLVDILTDLKYNVIGVQPAGKPDSDKYKNKRVELWINAHDRKLGIAHLSGEIKEQLTEELRAASWYENTGGKIEVTSKNDMKAKLGRSPDLADAYNLACHSSSVSNTVIVPLYNTARTKSLSDIKWR